LRKVAVDQGLPTELGEALKKEGYEVISPYRGQDVDAIITTGLDNNVMGMQDIKDTAPVINASGKSPGEIIERLRAIRFG